MGTRRRRVSVIRIRSKPVKWDDLRMEFISKCTADTISNAAQALINGHLVAFPTETVYGLGADATNEKAVSRIYSVKGRPVGHPLIVHISSINKLDQWATDIPDYAIKLAREFWPGPMTLILPRADLAKDYITGGQNNVGLRVPAQPIALALLNKFEELGGRGIAAPSANRFGAVSPTTAEAVGEELGEYLDLDDLVLDGGQCVVGIESTIIDCTGLVPRVLRPGAITDEMIEQALNKKPENIKGKSDIKSPGLLDSHYAPKAKISINALAEPGEGFLALSKFQTPKGAIRLASPSSLEQYARDLYSALRSADHQGLIKVAVLVPEGPGLAEAIRDRLTKAAAR
jgi:L-threonylcarbamoyladenylate synthase